MLALDRSLRLSRIRSLAFVGVLLSLPMCTFPPKCAAARCVVIVSIDGLRPDVALRADMPALRSLMARGSFTMFAATTDVAVTLPSHASMLTGVSPAKHGILFNGDPGPGDPKEPAWPTLFQIAHRAGLTTAMSAGKSKFSVFASPGALGQEFAPARGNTASDSVVAATASRWITTDQPRVLFVHFAGPDLVGHASGWGSPEQVAAAATADRALGRVLAALAGAIPSDSTLIIVSADHGGAGKTHGGPDARSHYIPWIAAGPGVRRDFDLTREPALQVRTEDTFATACAWLGLRIEKPVDGRAVTAIFAAPTPGP
jgi:arylsulfatase A-like enzyme